MIYTTWYILSMSQVLIHLFVCGAPLPRCKVILFVDLQVPEEYLLQDRFDIGHEYIITKPHLYDKLIAVYVS